MQGAISRLIYSELDHDGDQATLITTVFQVVDALYKVKVFKCGESGQIYVKDEFRVAGSNPEFTIECISAECPLFV